MNESSAFLWREAQKLDNFTVADLVKILTSEYDVDEATATADVLKLTNQWGVAGILEGDDIPVLKVEKNENEPADTPTEATVKKEEKEKKGFFKRLFK